MEKKYLIWIDILGFDKLAKEIGEKKKIDSRKVRKDYLNIIEEKVNEIIKDKIIVGKNYGERDDWILVAEDLPQAFFAISKILDHYTGYEDYKTIPLEIAVGNEEYDKWAKFDGKGLICEDNTITWLKTYIIDKYRECYKDQYGDSIKESFIVLTNSAYKELSEHYKKECTQYPDKTNKEEIHYFYSLLFNVIERERKISDFLQKISQSRSDYSGVLIDKIFVPPDEYDEIKETLKRDRIVFITGTAGYGKTYTAIRLLWEWYNDGYSPKWIVGKEERQREDVREKLANIDAELQSKHIIYFEDPFGKTKYERRDDLKERVNYIINSVKNKDDVYVVVTSRKDVFEEFEKESYSVEEIKNFERELNILKPSYSYKKRKEILIKWAEEKKCNWLLNNKLKMIAFESIKEKEILPTPLSIYDFTVATKGITNKKELNQKIKEYSQFVEKAFADEIKGLYDSGRKDRVLFLSFIFISQDLDLDLIKIVYNNIKKENYVDFEDILKEEYRIKTYYIDWMIRVLQFSHPSYFNALPYILDHPGCKNTFCDSLIELSQYDEGSRAIASTIVENFDKLPENVRNRLLLLLSEKDRAAGTVARAIARNFDMLPEKVQNLLFKLSKKDKAVGDVARAVANNFNKLPKNVQNLLFKLSEKDKTAWRVAAVVTKNFDKLPENVRNRLLLSLSEKDRAVGYIIRAIAENFDKLPNKVQRLLFTISKKGKTAFAVASAVAENFDKLPEKVQNLLFRFSEKDETARDVALAVAKNFDKLPKKVRNELLLNLSEKDETARDVALAVAGNFDKLPERVQNLLFKLSEKEQAAGAVARAVAYNYDKLPYKVQNLLDKLQKSLQIIISLNVTSDVVNHNLYSLELIYNTWSKIESDFLLMMLGKLSKKKNRNVRIRAIELRKKIFGDYKK